MKKTMIVLMLTLGVNVSAQISNFEGFWMSVGSIGSSYSKLIIHNSDNNLLTLNSFSFSNNTLVKESISSITNNEINTVSQSENNWNLLVKYTMINDTLMKASLTGSATQTLIYEKITD